MKNCDMCDNLATRKLALTTADGALLDEVYTCDECASKTVFEIKHDALDY